MPSAHPFAQVAVVILCVIWFLVPWRVDILTGAVTPLRRPVRRAAGA